MNTAITILLLVIGLGGGFWAARKWIKLFNESDYCPHCGHTCHGKSVYCTKYQMHKDKENDNRD